MRAPVFPIEWGALAPLRLRARAVAEGVYAGPHRSIRKGSGVEFGGQRAYVPGDPLDPATRLGPLASVELRDRLHTQVQKSLAAGALLMLGGAVPERAGGA